mgnify:CR=1 FL=1
MQVAVIRFFDSKCPQIPDSGTFQSRAAWVEARSVAGTFKPEVALFHCTAKVCAFEADRCESIFIVDDDGWDVGKNRSTVERIIIGGANIKFGLRRFVGLIIQKADHSADAK